MKTRMTLVLLLTGLGLATGQRADAQEAWTVRDIQLMRQDIPAMKRQLIAARLNLTADEAQQFWPIYDQFAAEMAKIIDRKLDLIQDYVANYDSLTDQQADAYIKGRADVEESTAQLRLKYLPIFRKALSGKTAARFSQIEWRLSLAVDLQIHSDLPVIKP